MLLDTAWCYTRTHLNRSGMVGFWGKCGPQCQGEMPLRGSAHNLAGASFDDLWTTSVFDLKTWGSGICHTYNPLEKSMPGNAGLLYALIGDVTSAKINVAEASFRRLTIYLHHPGSLWPELSNDEGIKLNLNENVDITFLRTIYSNLNTEKDPCAEWEHYSFTDCLQAYVAQMAGCQLDWFTDNGQQKGNYCDSPEDIQQYMKVLETLNMGNKKKMVSQTGKVMFL
jgi:hypothetical protein